MGWDARPLQGYPPALCRRRSLGTGHCLLCERGGGGGGGGGVGGFWAKHVEIRSPFKCYFIEVIPLITLDNFCDAPPPMSGIVQADLRDPPLNSFKMSSEPPLWTLSDD